MTPEEFLRWRGIYPLSESVDTRDSDESCFLDYWWIVDDDPDLSRYTDGQLHGIAENESAWLVDAGFFWGPMAAGATSELWAWNGKSARRVAELSRMIS